MTPPKQSSEPLDSSYGQYTGNQSFDQQQYAPSYTSPTPAFDDDFADAVAQRVVQQLKMEEPGGKVYPQQHTADKNVLRIIVALVSMFMFFPFAFFFLIMIGGAAGLVGFCIVGFTIFVTVLVVLDKIK